MMTQAKQTPVSELPRAIAGAEMIDPYAYNITVRRCDCEGETCFEARILEFPDVIEYADTYEEAYSLAIDTIETTAVQLHAMGKEIPEAYNYPADYSGRICRYCWMMNERRLGAEVNEDANNNREC